MSQYEREAQKNSMGCTAILATIISLIGIIGFIGTVSQEISERGVTTAPLQLQIERGAEIWLSHLGALLILGFFIFLAYVAVRQRQFLSEPEPPLNLVSERGEGPDWATRRYESGVHKQEAKWEDGQSLPSRAPEPHPAQAIPLEDIALNDLPTDRSE